MSEIFIDNNILKIGDVRIIEKYPIKKVEKVGNKYIVLLKIPRVELGIEELNNIVCYNAKGEKCWRISNALPTGIISKEQIPYVTIQVVEKELYATDFWGRKFKVNVESGKLLDVKIVH